MSKKKARSKRRPRRSTSQSIQKPKRSTDSDLPVRRTGEGVESRGEPKVVGVAESVSFSGPLPPPPVLKQYDDLVPGSAERIIRITERALDHQIDFGSTALRAVVANTKRGQVLGFVVVIAALVCSMIALYTGHESVAQILGGGTVISLAAIFVLGRLPGWLKSFGRPSE